MTEIGKTLGLIALVGLLASCGVDGAPIPPSDAAEDEVPGVSVSGTASFGVVGGNASASVSRK